MGVSGASPSHRRYNLFQQPSPTSCMKSLPHASAPTSPAVRDAFSPSAASPSTSRPKPSHPTPPPLHLPATSLPLERPPPQLSSTFVSPATVPSPAQPQPVQLRDQSASTTFGPTLLAVPSQPQPPPSQPTRPLSARLSQKAQEQVPSTPDSPDELDTIEIRFYPFPPPRHPLTYPLPTSASSFSSKPQLTNGLRSTVNEKVGIRKRLLARWRSEKASQSAPAPSRSHHPQPPSNELNRVQSAISSAKRKRARAPHRDEDDDDPQHAPRSTSNTNGDGSRGKRARSTHHVGTSALSSSPSVAQSAHTAPHFSAETKAHTSESQRRGTLPGTPNEGDVEAGRTFPSSTYGDGNTGRGSRNHSPRNVQSRQAMLNASRSTAQLYGKSNGQFSSSLEQLQNQIETLKQRRLRLEDDQFKEISRKASAMFSNSATKEQRLRLKSDIEKLSPRATRDMLLHISRRCRGFRVVDHEEVQLQIDLLPPELVGELELIVMHDKGQVQFDGHAELQKVRTKLWNCLEEYRTILSSLNSSEPT